MEACDRAKFGKRSLHAYHAAQLHTAGDSLFYGGSLRRALIASEADYFVLNHC